MATHDVTVFRPYSFEAGERIRIEGGPRGGDWLVVECGPKKVRLRCPVSGREVEWASFCYHVARRQREEWPRE